MEKKVTIFPRPGRDYQALGGSGKAKLNRYYESIRDRQAGSLIEIQEDIGLGVTNHWYEYVPASYDGSKAVPLVISCHGGHVFAQSQMFDTYWCEISEREGFLVVFPDASIPGAWSDAEESLKLEPDAIDYRFMQRLIEVLKEKYNIDPGRIYLQGFSRGNLYTTEFAISYGRLLAGMGESSGPSSPDIVDCSEGGLWERVPAVPCIQMRNSFDVYSPHFGFTRGQVNAANRRFRMKANGCTQPPVLQIGSRELFAYYKGEKADLIYRESIIHGHYETPADAEDCWALFSTFRRAEDGTLVSTVEDYTAQGDKNAIALADNCAMAYIDNKLVALEGNTRLYREANIPKSRGGFQRPNKNPNVAGPYDGKDIHVYYYAPVVTVARIFGGQAHVEEETAGITLPNGTWVEFAKGSSAAVVNNRVRNMGQTTREVDGQLCVPIDWFAESVMGLCTAEKNGVIYIADHQVTMTDDFSTIIREILGG